MARVTHKTWGETHQPRWAGDYHDRNSIIPGGAKVVAAQFPIVNQVVVTVTTIADAAATAIAVSALSGPIPSGTLMSFSTGEFAKLTANAAAGATSLTVEALVAALEVADTFTYTGGETRRYIPAGTLIGRTYAEQTSGTAFGPWTTGDDQVYLVLHDIWDATEDNDVDLYRNDHVVKENFLPGWTTSWTSDMKAAMRGKYYAVIGAS